MTDIKKGDEVYVHGFVDEVREGIVILKNKGGFFRTTADEIMPPAQPERKVSARKVVEFHCRAYRNGGYIDTDIAFAANEIALVTECDHDCGCTNIVTKEGKVFKILMPFKDVVQKISEVRGDLYFCPTCGREIKNDK